MVTHSCLNYSTQNFKFFLPKLLILCGIFSQILFAPLYWNDKTSSVAKLTESYLHHGGIAGKNIPCVNKDGSLKYLEKYAEEAPLFHYSGVALRFMGLDPLYLKIVPLFYWLLVIFGLLKCLLLFRPNLNSTDRRLALLVLLFTPLIFIHLTRYIPDPSVMAFGIFGLYFAFQRRWLAAVPFVLIACLIKPLALATFFSFFLGYLLFDSKDSHSNKILIGLAFATLGIGAVTLWFGTLYWTFIENPLLCLRNVANPIDTSNITPALFSLKYWSRYITWVIVRGISIPFALFAILQSIRFIKNWKNISSNEKILVSMLCFSPIFWALVRGPQYTGPWYTLYVLPGFSLLSLIYFLELNSKLIRMIALIYLIVSSFLHLGWTFNLNQTGFQPLGDIPIQMACGCQPLIRKIF